MPDAPEFDVVTRDVPTAYFFGVTTGRSLSRRMFPRWAEILGLGNAELVGLDLPINGPAEVYRRAIYQIKCDPLSLGAVITTHKLNTLSAARDLFDVLTAEAQLTQEVASVYKRDGKLVGHAVDPITSGLSMQQFVPPGTWNRSKAHILCLGAGGSATAISVYLTRTLPPEDRPTRVIFVNRGRPRLDSLRDLLDTHMPASGIEFEFVENSDPAANDRLMAALPPGSMVINATGMGKDTPGSPITDEGVFPQGGFAWELNYRGELDFLHQAERQRAARNLTVVDGWYYFLAGWSMIVGQIFDVDITPALFNELRAAAEALR
ncbi:shikimate dehydrogenase family protein [Aggregatilinea lenta]|uniref:shikimate dehydrogenase family protein n=1 Tax=Aggregatilinea lenta TaxID=913108 RepID=UPI000E5C2923|nr:shikimate dehydrogenase [Aggregatilinea lenta]